MFIKNISILAVAFSLYGTSPSFAQETNTSPIPDCEGLKQEIEVGEMLLSLQDRSIARQERALKLEGENYGVHLPNKSLQHSKGTRDKHILMLRFLNAAYDLKCSTLETPKAQEPQAPSTDDNEGPPVKKEPRVIPDYSRMPAV
jgi:hypothetical protein